jgi:hypothetical protein
VHLRRVDLEAVPAVPLGAVHRQVGVAQQVVRAHARTDERDADAGGHDHLAAGGDVRQRQHPTQPAGDLEDRLRAAAGDECDELVAAEARDDVGVPQALAHAGCSHREQVVTGRVPAVSLTDLKSSRSRNSTAKVPLALSTPRTRVRWSVKEARLSRPVSSSYAARVRSSDSSSMRSLTSRVFRIIPVTTPSSGRR